MPTGSFRQRGFTYIGLLVAVAFFGFGSVGAARLLASTERSEKELELLFVGNQYRQAIRSYFESGQVAGKYPQSLADLLQDSRYPTPRRHLRKLFTDPVTGAADWTLILAPEGGIMGVHSSSEREPMKRTNFAAQDSDFAMSHGLSGPVTESKSAANTSPFVGYSLQTQTKPMVPEKYSYKDWTFTHLVAGVRPLNAAGQKGTQSQP